MMLYSRVLALLLTVILIETAHGDFVIHTDLSSFTSSVSTFDLESIEGLTAKDVNSYPGGDTEYTLPAFTMSTLSAMTLGVYDEPDFEGTRATDGMNYVVTGNEDVISLEFQFTQPVLGFGLEITDFADDTASSIGLTIDYGTSVKKAKKKTGTKKVAKKSDKISDALTSNGTTLANSNVMFFGVTSDTPIWSIRLWQDSNDPFGIDAVRTSAAIVPVPNSALLAIVALAIGAVLHVRRVLLCKRAAQAPPAIAQP